MPLNSTERHSAKKTSLHTCQRGLSAGQRTSQVISDQSVCYAYVKGLKKSGPRLFFQLVPGLTKSRNR